MHSEAITQVIYIVGGTVFLLGVALSFLTTGARAAYYRSQGKRLPKLLVRDVIVKGGFAISFGLIAAVRFLPPDVRLAMNLGTNVVWALTTTIPACLAVVTYLYFELFVIDRDGGR